ncbi:unnamed protein product, partial [Amoebophrya sp. A120]
EKPGGETSSQELADKTLRPSKLNYFLTHVCPKLQVLDLRFNQLLGDPEKLSYDKLAAEIPSEKFFLRPQICGSIFGLIADQIVGHGCEAEKAIVERKTNQQRREEGPLPRSPAINAGDNTPKVVLPDCPPRALQIKLSYFGQMNGLRPSDRDSNSLRAQLEPLATKELKRRLIEDKFFSEHALFEFLVDMLRMYEEKYEMTLTSEQKDQLLLFGSELLEIKSSNYKIQRWKTIEAPVPQKKITEKAKAAERSAVCEVNDQAKEWIEGFERFEAMELLLKSYMSELIWRTPADLEARRSQFNSTFFQVDVEPTSISSSSSSSSSARSGATGSASSRSATTTTVSAPAAPFQQVNSFLEFLRRQNQQDRPKSNNPRHISQFFDHEDGVEDNLSKDAGGPRRDRIFLQGPADLAVPQYLCDQLLELLIDWVCFQDRFHPNRKRERPSVDAEHYMIVSHKDVKMSEAEEIKLFMANATRHLRDPSCRNNLHCANNRLIDLKRDIWALAEIVLRSALTKYNNGADLAFVTEHWDQLAVTHNFQGSPHIDHQNKRNFYAISVGNFKGGEICVEKCSRQVAVVNTRNRIAKIDGRFVHWVADWVEGWNEDTTSYAGTQEPRNTDAHSCLADGSAATAHAKNFVAKWGPKQGSAAPGEPGENKGTAKQTDQASKKSSRNDSSKEGELQEEEDVDDCNSFLSRHLKQRTALKNQRFSLIFYQTEKG